MEQLCINFANEKLQNLFNYNVFKKEEALYKAEGIPDEAIPEFQDNTPCCKLIAGRYTKKSPIVGIFTKLDDLKSQRNMTNEKYCEGLIQYFGRKKGQFKKAKNEKVREASKYFYGPKGGNESFFVRHFAGDVEYHVKGWLEKNDDKLPLQLQNLMEKSKSDYLLRIYGHKKSPLDNVRGVRAHVSVYGVASHQCNHRSMA